MMAIWLPVFVFVAVQGILCDAEPESPRMVNVNLSAPLPSIEYPAAMYDQANTIYLVDQIKPVIVKYSISSGSWTEHHGEKPGYGFPVWAGSIERIYYFTYTKVSRDSTGSLLAKFEIFKIVFDDAAEHSFHTEPILAEREIYCRLFSPVWDNGDFIYIYVIGELGGAPKDDEQIDGRLTRLSVHSNTLEVVDGGRIPAEFSPNYFLYVPTSRNIYLIDEQGHDPEKPSEMYLVVVSYSIMAGRMEPFNVTLPKTQRFSLWADGEDILILHGIENAGKVGELKLAGWSRLPGATSGQMTERDVQNGLIQICNHLAVQGIEKLRRYYMFCCDASTTRARYIEWDEPKRPIISADQDLGSISVSERGHSSGFAMIHRASLLPLTSVIWTSMLIVLVK